MVIEEVVNISTEVLSSAILEVGKVALWMQAIGILLVLWISFYIIMFFQDRKKLKKIDSIKKDVIRIEKKLDKLSKRN
ncbi:MAG: hypothetical protein QF567_01740 [Candidatus Pacearchaeota archaeon]|jgi:hypothetical protein|nr:hypothetical protein [Candidatus Pacearchaeota archaeon]MDP7520937.1 hypothetical protein [Candidatus Pacearchaeota archaeon]|tara:strand:+ start:3156 stop:3389 length:234 start_codon:yes stop_codon:yes gene_type:complete